jgi:hypothetical protein
MTIKRIQSEARAPQHAAGIDRPGHLQLLPGCVLNSASPFLDIALSCLETRRAAARPTSTTQGPNILLLMSNRTMLIPFISAKGGPAPPKQQASSPPNKNRKAAPPVRASSGARLALARRRRASEWPGRGGRRAPALVTLPSSSMEDVDCCCDGLCARQKARKKGFQDRGRGRTCEELS